MRPLDIGLVQAVVTKHADYARAYIMEHVWHSECAHMHTTDDIHCNGSETLQINWAHPQWTEGVQDSGVDTPVCE
jgi:hypothetical protein